MNAARSKHIFHISFKDTIQNFAVEIIFITDYMRHHINLANSKILDKLKKS